MKRVLKCCSALMLTAMILLTLAGCGYKEAGDFLLIADEMGGTLQNGMFEEGALLKLLQTLPESVHVALTGRDFPAGVLAMADLISEIQNRRHPFDRGVAAVEGLEF